METAIYIGTAVITIGWSVWLYLSWSDRERLEDYAGRSFWLIAGPSAYFLLLAMAGWQRAQALRLDLIGLALYDALILLCWLALLASRALGRGAYKRAYRGTLALFNVLAVALLAGVYLVRLFPPLLIRLTALAGQGLRLEFFRFAWVGLDPETHEQDFISMANKLLIALLTYIPIGVLRAVYLGRQMRRQRRELVAELECLRLRVAELERRLAGLDAGLHAELREEPVRAGPSGLERQSEKVG
jgi:hypothetical protein